MSPMASQITSLTIVFSTVYSGADQRKHKSSESQAFAWGIHRWPVCSPHKWLVTRKMFPFDDAIMQHGCLQEQQNLRLLQRLLDSVLIYSLPLQANGLLIIQMRGSSCRNIFRREFSFTDGIFMLKQPPDHISANMRQLVSGEKYIVAYGLDDIIFDLFVCYSTSLLVIKHHLVLTLINVCKFI